MVLRDYDAANRVIAATPARFADEIFVASRPPFESFDYGLVARARGDRQKALPAFAAARKKVEATWGDKAKDSANIVDVADYFAASAIFDAGLGQKEDAIREAQRAVDLVPIAKNSVSGPVYVDNLAWVYAWTGERDRALEQLEIVAKLPHTRHTAISASIRAGMNCAVINASTRSLPRPRPPADSRHKFHEFAPMAAVATTGSLKISWQFV